MTDRLNSAERARNMAAIRSAGMKSEMLVRSLVHGMGYRYRLHAKDLPRKPDLVFRQRKKVIFVHGCFWHQHRRPAWKNGRPPKSNKEYWGQKLANNMLRDKANIAHLKQLGGSRSMGIRCASWRPETGGPHPSIPQQRVITHADKTQTLEGEGLREFKCYTSYPPPNRGPAHDGELARSGRTPEGVKVECCTSSS